MRNFWRGILIGGFMGVVIGAMSVPHFWEELKMPTETRKTDISSLASKTLQDVRDNVGEMWQRHVKE
jgi:hypothetical protein